MFPHIPYFNPPPPQRPQRLPLNPKIMGAPEQYEDESDAAAAAYQIPSFSRPQAEGPRTAAIAERAGIPTDPDIPEMNQGMAEELPVRATNIPSFSMPPRAAAPSPASVPAMAPPNPTAAPSARPPFTPEPIPRKPGTGWKGRLGSIGRGALFGMGMGGQQGGAGAIGGAIAGAITGGVSPKTVARWGTESDMAKWRRTHEAEQDDRDRELKRENIDEDNQRENQRIQIDQERNRINAGLSKQSKDESERSHRATIAKENLRLWEQNHFGELYPDYVTEHYPALKGQKSPLTRKAAAAEYSKTEVRDDGFEYGLRKDTGQWELTTDTDGQPFSRREQTGRDERTGLTPGEQEAKLRFEANEKQQQQARFEKITNDLGALKAKRAERAAKLKTWIGGIPAKSKHWWQPDKEGSMSPEELAQAQAGAKAELDEIDGQINELQKQAKENNPAKMQKRAAKTGAAPGGGAQEGRNVSRVYKASSLPQMAQALKAQGKIKNGTAEEARAYIEANGGTVSDQH